MCVSVCVSLSVCVCLCLCVMSHHVTSRHVTSRHTYITKYTTLNVTQSDIKKKLSVKLFLFLISDCTEEKNESSLNDESH